MRSQRASCVAPPAALEVTDWLAAGTAGWGFRHSPTPSFGGRIDLSAEAVRFRPDATATPSCVEAACAGPIVVGERFAIQFAARFHRLGLDDDGSGAQGDLRLEVGVKTPRGTMGVRFRFTGDRYEVGKVYKVVRTDGEWHTWRLDVDAVRKTVAMVRDGEYVCLHEGSARLANGVRLRVSGSDSVRSDVEIGAFCIRTLDADDGLGVLKPLAPEPDADPGAWRMWRRDERNTGATRLKGAITQPRIAWSTPVGMMAPSAVFLDLDGDGDKETLISHGGNLTAYRLDGSTLWRQRMDGATVYGVFDLAEDGGRSLVIASGIPSRLQILDAPTGRILYDCPHYPMAGVAGVRVAKLEPRSRGLRAVVWSPQHEIGFCLAFDRGIENARIAWKFNWRVTNFSPTVALADMDRDGVLDVVVTTYDRVFVFNGRNGRKLIDYSFPSGRNYGITVVEDIDGDGYPDVVILADYLREHIAVVKNEGGKSLRMLWDRFYEQDYPDDDKSLRLMTESVGDFDGDGNLEIAGSLFDGTDDAVWHTFLLDALTGAIKQDVTSICLIGVGPLFPGKPPVAIVSKPAGRTALDSERFSVWSFEGGAAHEIAQLPEGELLTLSSPRDFPLNVWSTHLLNTAAVRPFRSGQLDMGVFIARPARESGERSVEFLASGQDGLLETRWRIDTPAEYRQVSVSTRERPRASRILKQNEKAGRALDVAEIVGGADEPQLIAAGEDGAIQIVGKDDRVLGKVQPGVGFVTAPVVARLRDGDPPSILFFDAKGDLHCMRAPAVGSPRILWSRPASGSRPYFVPNLDTHGVPVIADIDGDGDCETLVALMPDRLVALDADGVEKRSWLLPDLPVQWACGRFDDGGTAAQPDRPGRAQLGLFVTYPAGAFLDMESVVLSSSDGREVWKSHCGNGPPAVFDLNGDGRDDILLRDLFERRSLDARTGRDILPIAMWAGYHTPVVVPLGGPDRPPGVVWVGGMYSLAAEHPIGRQVWWRPFKATGPQAVADVDGDGAFEIGGVTAGQLYNWPKFYAVPGPDKEFLCYDALTGAVKWTLPLGTTSSGVVAADVDGDGLPEFVFGTADGRLIALRGGVRPEGRVLWELAFPAALGSPIVCDVNGDGRMSILVSCADGQLYCVQ